MSAACDQDGSAPRGLAGPALGTRVLTALLFGVVVLGSIALGPLVTALAVGVMAALAVRELYPIIRPEGRVLADAAGVIACFACPVATALWGTDGLLWALSAFLGALLALLVVGGSLSAGDAAITAFGVLYVGFTLSHFVLVRGFGDAPMLGWDLSAGLLLALVVIASVWLNDSAAYLVGTQFGRHRMAPRISPKKSWEGFVGGTIGGLLPWILAPYLPGVHLSLVWSVLTGITVAVAVVLGDLAESRMKRLAGVKDSGAALPGHGGFLDRLDSLLLASLVAYWMLFWGGVR